MQTRTIDRMLLAGVAVLFIGLVSTLGFSLKEHVVKEGDIAPDFSVRSDSGRTLTRSDFGGKLLILNFWATWCAPCVDEVPALDALQKRLANQGLVVLGVSVDTDQRKYQQFLAKNRVSFQTSRDGEKKINAEYGTFKFPETYIIDRSGKILKKVIGQENWGDEQVVAYVQSLL